MKQTILEAQGLKISVSGWIIRYSNEIIKVIRNRYLGNDSIIITKCVDLRDGNVITIYNDFSNLNIEGDHKVIINCYNKKGNLLNSIMLNCYNKKGSLLNSIMLLMEDICKLS